MPEIKDTIQHLTGYSTLHTLKHSLQENIVCSKAGKEQPDKILILYAHYDLQRYPQSDGTGRHAPGANDNASGIAAMLEIARIPENIDTDYTSLASRCTISG